MSETTQWIIPFSDSTSVGTGTSLAEETLRKTFVLAGTAGEGSAVSRRVLTTKPGCERQYQSPEEITARLSLRRGARAAPAAYCSLPQHGSALDQLRATHRLPGLAAPAGARPSPLRLSGGSGSLDEEASGESRSSREGMSRMVDVGHQVKPKIGPRSSGTRLTRCHATIKDLRFTTMVVYYALPCPHAAVLLPIALMASPCSVGSVFSPFSVGKSR